MVDHLGLRVKDLAASECFFEVALAAGRSDNGPPGQHQDYGPTYYAAYITNPDGTDVEAVCVKE